MLWIRSKLIAIKVESQHCKIHCERQCEVEDDEDEHDVETPFVIVPEVQFCVDKLRGFFQSKDGGCQMETYIDIRRVKSQTYIL